MEQHTRFSGWLRWLTSGQGGRNSSHPGGRYAATAYPDPGTAADLRSIVFDDVPPGPGAGPGEGAVEAQWLFPAENPVAGTRLIITEGSRPVAVVEVQSAVAPATEPHWSFRVDSSFTITGRGTGVIGTLSGTIGAGPQPATMHTRQHTAIPVVVTLEYAKVGSDDRPALLVSEVDKEQVPSGTLVRSHITQPNL